MRFESSVLSISWIPSEAVRGMVRTPFEAGVLHYDDPPPDRVGGPGELESLRAARSFRFANELRAWIDAEDGAIVGHGQSGGGHIGITRVSLGRAIGFQAVALPDLRPEPEVETALERELAATLMRGGAKPNVQRVREGAVLVRQGEAGGDLFLLLDGLLSVEVDGEAIAEVGPGVILGERAVLEGGRRTATLRAVTSCRVAVASADTVHEAALAELSRGHRREETSSA